MSRPLLVTDCDEVLLHMVVPFREWLAEEHHVLFDFAGSDFAGAMRHKHDGTPLDKAEIWPLLDAFFATEMHRQSAISGAREGLERIAGKADIVILTNLLDDKREARAEQLRALGIDHPVRTNQGGKGEPLAAIIADHAPSVTVFIDDLANHHRSAARHAPDAWRLHMIGEPALGRHFPPAPHAHARIDDWAEAVQWICERFARGEPAPMKNAPA